MEKNCQIFRSAQNFGRGQTINVSKYCKGFTLAEILITLVIIGVVAALTIPSVVVSYQKKQTVTKLSKAYSELTQAIRLSEIENGVTDNWDYSLDGERFYNLYLKKYLSVLKILGNIDNQTLGIRCSWLNNNQVNSYDYSTPLYRFILNDGALISIVNRTDSYKPVYIDVNGLKSPNKFGKDIFVFGIQKKYKFTPYGFANAYSTGHAFGTTTGGNARNALLTNSDAGCSKNARGLLCAALIMADNWQIKDDYPW